MPLLKTGANYHEKFGLAEKIRQCWLSAIVVSAFSLLSTFPKFINLVCVNKKTIY